MHVTELVIKIASRCNLNCSYCYMYNKGDNTFENQPKFMSRAIMTELFHKVKRHCLQHDMDTFSFIFHGGEPLLTDKELIRFFIAECKSLLKGAVIPRFVIQTNATLLDEEWSRFLSENKVQLGISIDGTKTAHNRHRVYHSGKGSHQDVVNGILQGKKYNKIGILSVINIEESPLVFYEFIKGLEANVLNTLIPDATHDHPPFNLKDYYYQESTPIADWLIGLYEVWKKDKSPRPDITYFSGIVGLLLGKKIGNELIGKRENEVLVIETNGDIEASDPIKICGDAFTKEGMNIMYNELDEALASELANLYHNSHSSLCRQCEECPINDVCGGGYLPHRYSSTNGFNNPSVYCKDLLKLITHIQNDLFGLFTEELLEEAEVEKLNYDTARLIIKSNNQRGSSVNKISDKLEYFKKS